MEQTNNTKNTTTTEKINIFAGNKTWDTTLKDLEAWQVARRNLKDWLDKAETGTFGSFFESKTNRTAPFSLQNLAILCHTSSGYIGDLVRKAKTNGMEEALKKHTSFDEASCYIALILDCLAPNLAEDRAKREAARLARVAKWNSFVNSVLSSVESILDTWHEFDIPCNIASIRKIYAKYKDKDGGLNIVATLAETNLNADEIKAFEAELGLADGQLCDYWLDEQSLDNPPEKA